MVTGRPSLFTEDLAREICLRIALGTSLRQIEREEGMPAKPTILRWLFENKEFRDQYAHAKSAQMDVMGEDIIEIADDGSRDVRITEDGREIIDFDHIQRSKLRVDTRKWLMAKLAAKKYGDKQEQHHTGNVGLTLNINKGTAARGD